MSTVQCSTQPWLLDRDDTRLCWHKFDSKLFLDIVYASDVQVESIDAMRTSSFVRGTKPLSGVELQLKHQWVLNANFNLNDSGEGFARLVWMTRDS